MTTATAAVLMTVTAKTSPYACRCVGPVTAGPAPPGAPRRQSDANGPGPRRSRPAGAVGPPVCRGLGYGPLRPPRLSGGRPDLPADAPPGDPLPGPSDDLRTHRDRPGRLL